VADRKYMWDGWVDDGEGGDGVVFLGGCGGAVR